MSDSKFHPIPGYEGLYWIDVAGNVLNRANHYMKPIRTDKGLVVELRKNGQREKFLVRDLVIKSIDLKIEPIQGCKPVEVTFIDEATQYPIEEGDT